MVYTIIDTGGNLPIFRGSVILSYDAIVIVLLANFAVSMICCHLGLRLVIDWRSNDVTSEFNHRKQPYKVAFK